MAEPVIIVKDGSCKVIVEDGNGNEVRTVDVPNGTFPGNKPPHGRRDPKNPKYGDCWIIEFR